MKLKTNRFGILEISRDDVIFFPEGILGFSKYKNYFLVESNMTPYFLWLQSIDNGDIAFPLLEPQLFMLDYKVSLNAEDKKLLSTDKDGAKLKVLSVITLTEDPKLMSANLRAPIIINLAESIAKQVVLSDANYPVSHPIINDLQRMMSQSSNDILTVEDEECQVYRGMNEDKTASGDLVV